jgi:hypothetical protein
MWISAELWKKSRTATPPTPGVKVLSACIPVRVSGAFVA